MVSGGQEAGWSGSRFLARLPSSEGFKTGRSAAQLTPVVVDGYALHAGYWPTTLVLHHCVINCPGAFTKWQVASPRVSDPRAKDRDKSHSLFVFLFVVIFVGGFA